MARTLDVPIPQGVACTAKLFVYGTGTDTVAETIFTLTEYANRKGWASGAVTVTGKHHLILLDGTTVAGDFVGDVSAVDGSVSTFGENTPTVEADTQDIQSRIPAALVSGRMDSSIGAMAANVLSAAALAADAASEIAAAVETAILNEGDLSAVLEAIRLKIEESDDDLTTTLIANAIWANATRTLTSAANITSTGGTTVPQTGDSFAIVNSGSHGNPALKTLIDALDTVVDSILLDTGTDGVVLSAAFMNKIADHVRRRTQANVEASSDGDALSVGSEYGFLQAAQESSVASGVLTIKKTDGVTTLGTKTIVSSASAEPITGIQ